MITISYGILTHNEDESLSKLLALLVSILTTEDEIVIIDDFSYNKKTLEILRYYSSLPQVKLYKKHLGNNFGQQKNFLNQNCSKKYIFNLDADELPSLFLLQNLPFILNQHEDIDLFWLPRINIISNVTEEYLSKQSWSINANGWVNWPDYQGRIYKNKTSIKWKNKVHESIAGFHKSLYFPEDINYSLWHQKTIERQLQQILFYDKFNFWKIEIKRKLRSLFLKN
jgi:glycosyltransferase involved in cell wall biosynthesis